MAIICRFKEIQCPVNQHRKKINAVSWFKKNNNEKKKKKTVKGKASSLDDGFPEIRVHDHGRETSSCQQRCIKL